MSTKGFNLPKGGGIGGFNKTYLYIGLVVGWLIFGSLNQLQNAQEGCCKTGGCGTGIFYKISWGTSLGVSIFCTVITGIPLIMYIFKAIASLFG
jgi:hypothetical protein